MMTKEEKKKRAILFAVAYFIEQEKATSQDSQENNFGDWSRLGKELIMKKRIIIQSRGKALL